MHTLDPRLVTPAMAGKITEHASAVIDRTPRSVLARDFDKPSATYWLLVPSDSNPGSWREVRVTVHAGWWEAGHYGVACRASEAGRHCWHLYAAALWVARNALDDESGQPRYGGRIPVPTVRRLRPRPASPPAENRPVPRAARDGFYD